jgi:hypothetical protein
MMSIGARRADADADFETPAAQLIQRRENLGEMDGLVQRRDEHGAAQT